VLGIQAFEGGLAISLVPAVILTSFVLIGNPLIIMVIMGVLGFRSRTSFLASISVAQISEFSLIIIALGHRVGDLSASDVSLVTLVGMSTIFVSSYYIVYGDRLYEKLRPLLKHFEFRKKLVDELPPAVEFKNHVLQAVLDEMPEKMTPKNYDQVFMGARAEGMIDGRNETIDDIKALLNSSMEDE